jgi:hypothetical protein
MPILWPIMAIWHYLNKGTGICKCEEKCIKDRDNNIYFEFSLFYAPAYNGKCPWKESKFKSRIPQYTIG